MTAHTIGPDCWVPLPSELALQLADGQPVQVYSATMYVAVVAGEELPALVAIPQAEYARLLRGTGTLPRTRTADQEAVARVLMEADGFAMSTDDSAPASVKDSADRGSPRAQGWWNTAGLVMRALRKVQA